MPDLSGKKVLMIVAEKDFRDEEFFEPCNLLKKLGAAVTVASSVTGPVVSAFGKTVESGRKIGDCKAGDYDAVVFVGGRGADIFFEDEDAHALARAAVEEGKILAAICIAPVTLANAGVLKGRRSTCFKSFEGRLAAQGAILAGGDVARDGKILTASVPAAAAKFASELVKMLE